MSSGSRSRRCCPPIWGAAVIRSATIVVWSRIIYRYRTGVPWRDLPREQFGPWKTVWKRHRRYAGDGTWDTVLAALLAQADADGKIEWTVSVDATINRAHQHATNTTRPDQDTGGTVELHESARGVRVQSAGRSA
jgi:transposase